MNVYSTARHTDQLPALSIPTFGRDDDVSGILGLPPRTVTFGTDTWNFSSHPKINTVKSISFEDVPSAFKDIVKMLILARMDPDAVAEMAGDHVTSEMVRRAFGRGAAFGNPTTARGDVARLSLALRRLDSKGHLDGPITDWAPVTEILRASSDGNGDIGDGTLRRQIAAVIYCDEVVRALAPQDSDLARFGPFGSLPWNGKRPKHVIPTKAHDALNVVPPNPEVFFVLGFTDWLIEECGDAICALVEWFHTPNSKGTINPGNRMKHGRRPPDELWPKWWADQPRTAGTVHTWKIALGWACFAQVHITLAMRPQEIRLLARDCLTTTKTGQASIKGWVSKGNDTPVSDEWAAVPHAEKAISMMNRLIDATHVKPADVPLVKLIPSKGHRLFSNMRNHAPGDAMRWHAVQERGSLEVLKDAARHFSELPDGNPFKRDINLDIGVGGRELHVTAQEMRVTAGAAYRSHPMGVSLSQAFLKHRSKASHSGYVGHVYQSLVTVSQNGSASLLDQINDELRGHYLTFLERRHMEHVDRVEEHGDGVLGGLSGKGQGKLSRKWHEPETEGVFVRLSSEGRARLASDAPLSRRQITQIAGRNQNVAAGPLTHCFFDASAALCGGKASADFRLCQPLACGNSVMTVGQRALKELERRVIATHGLDLEKAQILPTISQHLRELEDEFDGQSDDDLLAIYLEECDEFTRLVIEGWTTDEEDA